VREGVLASLLAGESQHKTAQLYQVSKDSVSRIARAAGLKESVGRSATKNATMARVVYAAEARLALSDRLFARIEELLAAEDLEPAGLYRLVLAFAILVDKRRLEESAATERRESIDPRAVIERGREQMRLLQGGARRRGEEPAGQSPGLSVNPCGSV
jgi:hypothetical protein